MTDYILFKNLEGKYLTLPECLEVNKVDPDEVKEGESAANETGEAETAAVDENGEKVEAEVVVEDGSQAEDHRFSGT